MPRSDTVIVEVGGMIVENWEEYEIDSDLLVAADGWTLRCPLIGSASERLAWLDVVSVGATMRLYVGNDIVMRGTQARQQAWAAYIQHTGIVDTVEVSAGRKGESGTVVTITGRDMAAHLVDNSVHPSLFQAAGENLIALAEGVCSEFNIPVIADSSASRNIATGSPATLPDQRVLAEQARQHGVPVQNWSRATLRAGNQSGRPYDEIAGATDTPALERARRRSSSGQTPSDALRQRLADAKPQGGETAWEFLERHARHFGLLLWMSPIGELIIAAPTYSQRARFRFDRRVGSSIDSETTVLAGSYKQNGADRYSEVRVYGRHRARGAQRTGLVGIARATDAQSDPSWPRPHVLPFARRHVAHDSHATTQAELNRAARRVFAEHQQEADVYEVTAWGHGQREYLFGIDTVAHIDDQQVGLRPGDWYVTRRTFRKNRESGTTTDLRLIPRGRIAL